MANMPCRLFNTVPYSIRPESGSSRLRGKYLYLINRHHIDLLVRRIPNLVSQHPSLIFSRVINRFRHLGRSSNIISSPTNRKFKLLNVNCRTKRNLNGKMGHKSDLHSSDSKDAGGPPPITVNLPPPPYPMGVVSDYTKHNTPITLRIRELKSSFSGEDFTIKDAIANRPILRVDGKAFSFRGKKIMYDSTGKALFEFCRSGGFSRSYCGYEVGQPAKNLFTVETIGFIKPKLNVVFPNFAGDGRQERFTLRGKWLSGGSEITTDSGFVVASISRDYANMGEIFFSRQTYDVSVAPGIDAALISALCVCFDEAYSES